MKTKYFALGKVQSTIEGGKRCRLMAGCSLRHCPKGYCEGLQKVWEEWKAVYT
jgi:hypothetical protein